MKIKPSILSILIIAFAGISYSIWSANEVYTGSIKMQQWIDRATGIVAFVTAVIVLLRMNRKIRHQRQSHMRRDKIKHALQSVFSSIPLSIYSKDLQGKFILANNAFSESITQREESLFGKNIFDIMPAELGIKIRFSDGEVIKSRKKVELEGIMLLANESRDIHLVQFPLFDDNNSVCGIGGIVTDITERKQQQLADAKSAAVNAAVMQEQFLKNMSHEIRTPMNGITGISNMLKRTSLTDQQGEYVELILQSSEVLQELINGVLDLSKIKAGELIIENKPFSLRETVEQVTEFWRMKAKEKALGFMVLVDPDVPLYLTGDAHRLKQVLNNLLGNAIKFTHKGYVKITVATILKNESGNLHFEIADTGIGIPAEKMDHIFEIFTQLDHDDTRETGGAGIGLPISSKLIQLMNGTIQVESKPGIKTTFTVTIPCQLAEPMPETLVVQKIEAENGHLFTNKRVLVAEDNKINQKVIALQLSQFGIQPTIVSNGKELIKVMEQDRNFDMIIMDLRMPEMNGFQATLYLRNQLQSKIPIVAITASVLQREQKKCMEVGMNGFLAKPFSPGDISAVLHQFLNGTGIKSPQELQNSNNESPDKLYDLTGLHDLDEPGFVAEVLETFITSIPVSLEEIRLYAMQENWEQVYGSAHLLKTSAGLLHINSLRKSLSDIEQLSREKAGVKIIEITDLLEDWFRMIRPLLELEKEKSLLIPM